MANVLLAAVILEFSVTEWKEISSISFSLQARLHWQNGCGWYELGMLDVLLRCSARYWIKFSTSSRMTFFIWLFWYRITWQMFC